MRIAHRIRGRERTGEGSAKLLLTNKKGGYLLLGAKSDFNGFFTYESDRESLFKILHDIKPGREPEEVVNGLTWAERRAGEHKEWFCLSSNALIQEQEGTCTITLDCKRVYDDDTTGRHYESARITIEEHEALHITYEKKNDDGTIAYSRHVIILATPLHEKKPTLEETGAWRAINAADDAKRGMPAERWVYDACTIKGSSRTIITSSSSHEKALEKARYVLEHQHSIIDAIEQYPGQRYKNHDLRRALAAHSLDALTTRLKGRETRGVFAGLPWFFQYWMRDEAISMGALIIDGHYALAKEILTRHVRAISQGMIGANQQSTLTTADGPGLVAKKLSQLFNTLGKEWTSFFSIAELQEIKQSYDEYLETIAHSHGLVTNGPDETWMDTGGDRAGARIEIQCCTAAIYDLQVIIARLLRAPTKEYDRAREELLTTTRDWFYDRKGRLLDGFFKDGTPDTRTRPNCFLAWHLAPNLLSDEEWGKAFDHAIDKLWLEWGGFSSIDQGDERFVDEHTGVDNRSYHHGDSWYFMNNLAAIALLNNNPSKYNHHIHQITEASSQDLLFQGVIGHSSELSDAREQQAAGSLVQAWSAATLIELYDALSVD